VPRVLYVPGMRVSILSILALEYQGYSVSFFGFGVHIHFVRGQAPGPPMMIGISEDHLYKLWGQPIYNFKDGGDETVAFILKRARKLSSAGPPGGNGIGWRNGDTQMVLV
jgi:hypothetical protein